MSRGVSIRHIKDASSDIFDMYDENAFDEKRDPPKITFSTLSPV